jgi:hypothetical protein
MHPIPRAIEEAIGAWYAETATYEQLDLVARELPGILATVAPDEMTEGEFMRLLHIAGAMKNDWLQFKGRERLQAEGA